jgi:hypothetical protein
MSIQLHPYFHTTQPQGIFAAGSLMSWSNGWLLGAICKPITDQINQETMHKEQEERRNGGEGKKVDEERISDIFSPPSSSVPPFLLLKFKPSNCHAYRLSQRENDLVLIARKAKIADPETGKQCKRSSHER